jgi:hypothetical protein
LGARCDLDDMAVRGFHGLPPLNPLLVSPME